MGCLIISQQWEGSLSFLNFLFDSNIDLESLTSTENAALMLRRET